MRLKAEDLGWVAGFIEGEGSFGWAGTTPTVSAAQVQRWPLEKMLKICGGNISTLKREEVVGQTYYRWYIYGNGAVEIIKMIYPLLSPRRKDQAKKVYTRRYQQLNTPKPIKNVCKHGHSWVKENIYTFKKDGRQICKICARGWREKWLTTTKQKEY